MKRFLIAVLTVACLAFGAATQAHAEAIIGLNTANRLVTFDSATPGTNTANVAITGLQSGETLVGIDFRPATGVLYGIGTQGGVYTINRTTGAASLATTLTADPTDSSSPFTGLNGAGYGIDFNPTVDRLRLVSDANQNLRINVTTGGTITDTDLTFASGAGDPNITGSAYTNNVAGAMTTTLYGIDTVTNSLYTQNANPGILTLVGSLGVDPSSDLHGFDISGATGIAYAAFTVVGQTFSQLYAINLATGAATLIGQIGGNASIVGLAVIPAAAIPEPATMILLGTGLAGIAAKVRRRKRRA